MRLDAVFVLAPKPKPPSIPTRRAFLVAGCCSAGALVAGFGAGWLARGRFEPRTAAGPEQDARLQWALALARTGDPETLLEELPGYVAVVHEAVANGKDSELLWQGVRTGAEALLVRGHPDGSRARAEVLLGVIALGVDPALESMRERLSRLARR